MSAPGRLFEYTNDRCGEAQRDRPGPSQRAASERLVGPLWVGSTPRPTPLACLKAVVARAASQAGQPR